MRITGIVITLFMLTCISCIPDSTEFTTGSTGEEPPVHEPTPLGIPSGAHVSVPDIASLPSPTPTTEPTLHEPVVPPDTALITLPALDMDEVRRRDLEWYSDPAHGGAMSPIKTSEPRQVDIHPLSEGTWVSLPDGTAKMRLRVKSPGAENIALVFSTYRMPASGSLRLYSPDGKNVRGPFVQGSESKLGMLWPRKLPGDEIVMDLVVSETETDQVELVISTVGHGHDAVLFGPGSPCWPDCPQSEWCWPDAACAIRNPYEDIALPLMENVDPEELLRSVGQLEMYNGFCNCTGTLMKNTSDDGRMLFLTASHCFRDCMHRGPIYPTFEQVEDSVRVYWHHESQACRDYTYENEDATGSGDAPVEYVVGPGSTALLEHAWPLGWVLGDPGLPDYAYRDLLLLELVDPTDEVREGLCFAGWDITDMDIEPVLGFHHPFAQSKKMSFEYTSISTWISRPPIRRGSDGAVRQHST